MQKQVAQIEKQQQAAGKSRATLEKEKEKALREKAKLEEKLRTVVLSKHGNPRTTTDVRVMRFNSRCSLTVYTQIVCKYFIQAIETEKYVILSLEQLWD